jgi:hypothetical protein
MCVLLHVVLAGVGAVEWTCRLLRTGLGRRGENLLLLLLLLLFWRVAAAHLLLRLL